MTIVPTTMFVVAHGDGDRDADEDVGDDDVKDHWAHNLFGCLDCQLVTDPVVLAILPSGAQGLGVDVCGCRSQSTQLQGRYCQYSRSAAPVK